MAAASAEQPIFYPVLNEEYATKIARNWDVPASGSGYVTLFKVRKTFLDIYEVRFLLLVGAQSNELERPTGGIHRMFAGLWNAPVLGGLAS